ncbi:unnamed protein product [Closterium sp. NIES-54]
MVADFPTSTATTATAATATAATAAPTYCAPMASLRVLAFDHEGRPIQFDTWLDDLQLYLLSDSKDSVSLFDLASGAATAPPATADSATRSQWLTSDAAARLAIRNHLPLAECAHFGQHRHSFATVEDLVSHLRTSDARYRPTVLAEFLDRNQPPMFITLYFIVTRLPDSLRSVKDHFLTLNPTSLTIDLLEQHLLVAETSAVAVGGARGTPHPPFFEGCSPSPLAPSYASAAAADVSVGEDVGAASASAKRRSSKGKGGRGGGGGSVVVEVAVGVVVGAAVEVVEAVEVVAAVGLVAGVGALVAAVEAAVGVVAVEAVGLEAVGLDLGMEALVVASGSSSSSIGARLNRPSSSTFGKLPTQHHSFSRLDDAWRAEFGDDVELPRWADLVRSRIAIFDLDFDAILYAMYVLSVSAEGDCYQYVPPDPGIVAAALGASESGTLPGTAPAQALHTFTLDSRTSRCFFRDSTTLTPLPAPVPVRLADPSGGPIVARSSTVLPCPAVPSGSLSGAATAPPATADSATRSEWLTRDAAARLAIRNHLPLTECAHFGQHRTAQALYAVVVARYSSPATAALGRQLLPYLFPELSAFGTVEDLVSHLHTSDARYRTTVPAKFLDRNQPPMFITLYFILTCLPDSLRSVRDHFLFLDPTSLTIDLLEKHLLKAETSAVAVGGARGTPRPPFFEGWHSAAVLPCPVVPSGSLSCLHLPPVLYELGEYRCPPGCDGHYHHSWWSACVDLHMHTDEASPGHVHLSARVESVHNRYRASSGSCVCSGHPSLPHLHGMHSRLLVSGLPRSLPPLPPSPAPTCLPCVEGRQRAAPHSSFLASTAPLHSLNMDRFGQDLPVLRLHSDRGGEVSSNLLRDFCRGEGILQSFTLPDSPQQNGIAERRIGIVMEVARTSMIHAAAPHFLWPFAVRFAAHQLNLWPRVSLPETSPTLRWTGEVGDASVFQGWGSRAFVRDTSANKLSACAIPWDVTFDESVPFYRLFPYRSAPPPPPPLFLAPGPPPFDPLPPQGPAPLGVSQVDPLSSPAPIQEAIGSGAARGAASGDAAPRGAELGGAESEGAGSGGAEPRGGEPGGAEPVGLEPEGAELGGAESEGADSREPFSLAEF